MMLNENIREIRKINNMTQEQLAEVMGVSTASVSTVSVSEVSTGVILLLSLHEERMINNVIKRNKRLTFVNFILYSIE